MAHFFIRGKKLSFFVEFPKMGRADLRDFKKGIDENMSIDNSTHSLFGVSKASSDLLVQEYG